MHERNVYFLGPEGSYSDLASKKMFPYSSRVPVDNFQEITKMVAGGDAIGVLPVENSTTTTVYENLARLYERNLVIVGEFSLKIVLNLVGVEGCKLTEITQVLSHPKALEQCSEIINTHGMEAIPVDSTSAAMQQIVNLKRTDMAAIGSMEGAQEFGLGIIAENIGNFKDNQTRFVAVRKRKSVEEFDTDKATKVSLILKIKDEPGSLHKITGEIFHAGGNLKYIQSRPIPENLGSYLFLVDITGKDLSAVVRAVEESAQETFILGAYGTLPNS
ncbi:MAG TPA: prephenate dehydratase domain-containing protein [Alphaproteobacteria bacterium]|jgi:prephenate dehydratase|nr:prephenate dehydratase domain-containing protein [Alphaproteobacteria bacterium]